MRDIFFSGNAVWFSVPALLGTLIFFMRMAMMMLGSHHDVSVGDHGGSYAPGDHGDTHDSFRYLTLEGLTAAMMGFGWGGLAALKSTDWSLTLVMAVALGCGALMVVLQAFLLRSMNRLQVSGNISLSDAMNSEGIVYIEIPGDRKGKGQVTLVIQGKQRQINAITAGESLPSQTRVRVTAVNQDNTVTVQKT